MADMISTRRTVAALGAANVLALGLVVAAGCGGGSSTEPEPVAGGGPAVFARPLAVPTEVEQQKGRSITFSPATIREGYVPGETRGPDVRRIRARYGPFRIGPGQNPNLYDFNLKAPEIDGYITRVSPNLESADGKIPSAEVIHLHHGVWLVNGRPMWFADAEKTQFILPEGYGWRTRPGDKWALNHMLHNYLTGTQDLYLSWDMDVVPADSPTGRRMRAVDIEWIDTRGGEAYPVFDVPFTGKPGGTYTYPTDDPKAYTPADPRPYLGEKARNQLEISADAVLVGAVGHLHPGGLSNTVWLRRGGRRVPIHTGSADYHDPKGPVSWDLSLRATTPDWRVRVKRGDVLEITSTYDTEHGAWLEAMGLATLFVDRGGEGGVDPFATRVDRRTRATHGPLPENRQGGGAPSGLPDPATLPNGPLFGYWDGKAIRIDDFRMSHGDLLAKDERRNPPLVSQGVPLSFINVDAERSISHTITACKAPCTGTPGTGFPLADTTPTFDSGQLGFGPKGITAFTNTASWQTPENLTPGTYTYFCRIHPFMRGTFRVVQPLADPGIASLASAGELG